MSNLFLCNPLAKKPVIILVLSGRCLFLNVVSRALRRAIARESLGNGAVPLRLMMGGAFAFLIFSNYMLVYEAARWRRQTGDFPQPSPRKMLKRPIFTFAGI